MPRLRDERDEYTVARAVWLYTRLCMASSAGESGKAFALTQRLTRWLATSPRRLVAEYYSRTCMLDYDGLPEATKEKAAERARARGQAVIEMARAAEAAEAAEAEEAEDGDAEVEVPQGGRGGEDR